MYIIDNITVIKGWLIYEFLKDTSWDQAGWHFSVVLYLNLVYSKKLWIQCNKMLTSISNVILQFFILHVYVLTLSCPVLHVSEQMKSKILCIFLNSLNLYFYRFVVWARSLLLLLLSFIFWTNIVINFYQMWISVFFHVFIFIKQSSVVLNLKTSMRSAISKDDIKSRYMKTPTSLT